MDQPTESISSHDASSRQDDRWFGRPERWWLPQDAVRAVHVVMIGVLGQHRPRHSCIRGDGVEAATLLA
jgi:hypothetical protein